MDKKKEKQDHGKEKLTELDQLELEYLEYMEKKKDFYRQRAREEDEKLFGPLDHKKNAPAKRPFGTFFEPSKPSIAPRVLHQFNHFKKAEDSDQNQSSDSRDEDENSARQGKKVQEKRRNNLKDFLDVAGPMSVTHFLMLSKPKSVPHLRVARTPQGPTLTFEIKEYALASDIARAQTRPRCPQSLFVNSPLIVLSGFGNGGQHLKLTTIMFQNIFPAIDINTVMLSSCERIVLLNYDAETKIIEFQHYSIRLHPIGVSRRIRKFVLNHHVRDLRSLQDVSDFVTKATYGSESEADEESATVSLTSDFGRVNRASMKSAVRLQEIGPRLTLKLVKIEEGLCSGGVIFSEYDTGKPTKANHEGGYHEELAIPEDTNE